MGFRVCRWLVSIANRRSVWRVAPEEQTAAVGPNMAADESAGVVIGLSPVNEPAWF